MTNISTNRYSPFNVLTQYGGSMKLLCLLLLTPMLSFASVQRSSVEAHYFGSGSSVMISGEAAEIMYHGMINSLETYSTTGGKTIRSTRESKNIRCNELPIAGSESAFNYTCLFHVSDKGTVEKI